MHIRATEEIAREVIQGQFEEIQGYTNPTNDGMLAPWMMALDRAQRMAATLQNVVDAIGARHQLTRVGQGMSIPGEARWNALSREEKAEIEAEFSAEVAELERINQAKPDPFFQPVEAALAGLTQQLRDLNFEDPMAFEQAVTIGAEIERTAGRAVEDRGEMEFTAFDQDVEAHISSLESEGIAEREAVAVSNRIERAKVDPFFQPIEAALAMVRPPHLAEGA